MSGARGEQFYIKPETSGVYLKNLSLNVEQFFSNVNTTGTVIGSNLIYNTGNNNISGTLTANNLVYNTGYQTISGVKTFFDNINISGTGTFNGLNLNNINALILSGMKVTITGSSTVNVDNDIFYKGNKFLTGIDLSSNTSIVFTTGNQIISGVKIFNGNLTVSGNTTISDNLNALGNYYVKVARTTNQTINNGSNTTIQFSSVTDPNSWYNASTYRATPTVSGNYVINLMVNWQKGTINDNQNNIQIQKNGNTISINKSTIVTGDDNTSFATAIATLNGSSDYIEATAYTANPTSQVINGTVDGAWTKMELFKLN